MIIPRLSSRRTTGAARFRVDLLGGSGERLSRDKKKKEETRGGQAPRTGDAIGLERREKIPRPAGAIKLSGKRTSKNRPLISPTPSYPLFAAERRARLNCRGKDRERSEVK